MKFHSTILPAMTAAAVIYIIVTNLPAAEDRVMYVYYIKVRYCNKELQLSLQRPTAHIIIINNNNMAVAINLLLSLTIDDGGGGVYTIIINFPVAEELCRYIILW